MSKLITACLICSAFLLGQTFEYEIATNEYDVQTYFESGIEKVGIESNISSSKINHISMDVPNIDSSFKAYMDYRTITNTSSDQYKYISRYGRSDSQGFMRANADPEIPDDYYLIALGSYYGTEIGTKYRFTTNTGNVFYGVLADCKDDIHTNSTNQYTTVGTPNVVEFIVDVNKLDKNVKYHGSANVYSPLKGSIVKIERIEV